MADEKTDGVYVVLVEYNHVNEITNSTLCKHEVIYISDNKEKAMEQYRNIREGENRCLFITGKLVVKTELDINYLDTEWLCNQELIVSMTF